MGYPDVRVREQLEPFISSYQSLDLVRFIILFGLSLACSIASHISATITRYLHVLKCRLGQFQAKGRRMQYCQQQVLHICTLSRAQTQINHDHITIVAVMIRLTLLIFLQADTSRCVAV